MKRSPIRRKTPMKRSAMPRVKPEKLRIGRMEYKIPAGTTGIRREMFVSAAEDHAMRSGKLTVADAAPILKKRRGALKAMIRQSERAKATRRRSKYARRERFFAQMMWVKTQQCAVLAYWMPWEHEITSCYGPIEADHMGDRGLSHKADDDTCGPLCTRHHRERTDHSGTFRSATKAELREWRAGVIAATQAAYLLAITKAIIALS